MRPFLRAFRRGTGSNPVESNEVLQLKERIARQEKRLTELDNLLAKLYEDLIAGKIKERNFDMLAQKLPFKLFSDFYRGYIIRFY